MSSDVIYDEAEEFNRRIEERSAAGFIPDLRRAVKCDYFFKSFWRDPYYIKLYLGSIVDLYLRLLKDYSHLGVRVLDVGCGSGYFSLELAREGYHVTGIDIASSAIAKGKETAADNPFTDTFGSLAYRVSPFHQMEGEFDVILFSGSLHHMENRDAMIKKAHGMIKPGGLVIAFEPTHERWTRADASHAALIRGLLSITGHWYEPDLTDRVNAKTLIDDILEEYVKQGDKNEPVGQSPHDDPCSGKEIEAMLKKNFTLLEDGPGHSFIYRILGGLRGEEETIYKLADFITSYEREVLDSGIVEPTNAYFAGRREP